MGALPPWSQPYFVALSARQKYARLAAVVAEEGHLQALRARAALLLALAHMTMDTDLDAIDEQLATWLPTLMRDGNGSNSKRVPEGLHFWLTLKLATSKSLTQLFSPPQIHFAGVASHCMQVRGVDCQPATTVRFAPRLLSLNGMQRLSTDLLSLATYNRCSNENGETGPGIRPPRSTLTYHFPLPSSAGT
jgi:hypothetical protein